MAQFEALPDNFITASFEISERYDPRENTNCKITHQESYGVSYNSDVKSVKDIRKIHETDAYEYNKFNSGLLEKYTHRINPENVETFYRLVPFGEFKPVINTTYRLENEGNCIEYYEATGETLCILCGLREYYGTHTTDARRGTFHRTCFEEYQKHLETILSKYKKDFVALEV